MGLFENFIILFGGVKEMELQSASGSFPLGSWTFISLVSNVIARDFPPEYPDLSLERALPLLSRRRDAAGPPAITKFTSFEGARSAKEEKRSRNFARSRDTLFSGRPPKERPPQKFPLGVKYELSHALLLSSSRVYCQSRRLQSEER